MSQKAIREYDGKAVLARYMREKWPQFAAALSRSAQVTPRTVLSDLPGAHPWLQEERLVAKPDVLLKRRGKAGLIKLNADWADASAWVAERRGREVDADGVRGVLGNFVVEPFVAHEAADEYYVCIASNRDGDEILFYHEGGVDVGDVDAKAVRLQVLVGDQPARADVLALVSGVPERRRAAVADFLVALFEAYTSLYFAYLEVNPLVVTGDDQVHVLDLAAKLDETARFEVGKAWGSLDFPAPFGRPLTAEEQHIAELDGKTGASLKLTVLNPDARYWTMVAGGGASVVYTDTLVDLGFGAEIANYGEYSGAPSKELTYEYARTVLGLMTREAHPDGKRLIIGGSIANFTDVASTFRGIIEALTEFADTLRAQRVRIYVRRGGPNYQEGLNLMRQTAVDLDLPIVVHGPERHITAVVAMAVGLEPERAEAEPTPSTTPRGGPGGASAAGGSSSDLLLQRSASPGIAENAAGAGTGAAPATTEAESRQRQERNEAAAATAAKEGGNERPLFTSQTRAFVYGMQPTAVQNMLDADYIARRAEPSVAAMVYPFSGNHFKKFYWSDEEVLVPIYQHFAQAAAKFPDVDVVVNFASFRSVYESTMEILQCPQIRTIAIIAEGVPERRARLLLREARKRGVTLIGPATVGGIKPGCFRIGNTGGMLDNIISSKLYRPGSVAYVTRSGGLSNEMNNIVSRNSDGVYEGVAIGGDMYPGSTFLDHLLRYERDPNVKMVVMLGEVGGTSEYEVVEALKDGRLTKPLVAWCIGTCSAAFSFEVQFGHAGACATAQNTTARAKNAALQRAGAVVPSSFNSFGTVVKSVYKRLVRQGVIDPQPDRAPPPVPVDYKWARQLGLVRKSSNFISTISDERGDELTYAGMPISEVFSEKLGVGGVIGLLFFRKRLPDYFCRFIELVLMVTADHGPAVSGAHNTIVCARAGKDLVSSLASGLLTIGPRFGGALDGAARLFSEAFDSGMSPEEFVVSMRKKKKLILGIGHKVKSLENPDKRVTIVKDFVRENFKSTDVFDYACSVELVTTRKKSSLILNVDGAIACAFVDLLRSCGAFSTDEAAEYIELGTLNGLFVLGRSIGFVGHFIDQGRLKQPLYRHDTDDISYIAPSASSGLH